MYLITFSFKLCEPIWSVTAPEMAEQLLARKESLKLGKIMCRKWKKQEANHVFLWRILSSLVTVLQVGLMETHY